MDAERIKELRGIAWQNDVNALSGHSRGLARLVAECLDEIERLRGEVLHAYSEGFEAGYREGYCEAETLLP